MTHTYVVLGAGRQGTAAGYDMAKWGEASEIRMADVSQEAADAACRRINQLIGRQVAKPVQVNVEDQQSVAAVLKDADACLSAVPYYFNLSISRTAVETKTHYCDLGGHTGIAREQHGLSEAARQAGVSVIPNCGQVPGMGTTLMVHAMQLLDEAVDIFMWDGGIPKHPKPPFNYYLTFNVEGLTNEYAEDAVFLRDWKVTEVPTMTELETVEFPQPIGKLEAFVAGGGTDTMPWTFEGKIRTLQNKTLRWPGHFAQIRAFYDLGLWDTNPIQVGGQEIIPRQVFHALFEPKVTFPGDPDLVIVRVDAVGKKGGKDAVARVEVIDELDPVTGFTAMERCTGWSAAIVAEMMAQGETPTGAGGVETMVPPRSFVTHLRQHGIPCSETIIFS